MSERARWQGSAWAIDLRLEVLSGFRGNATRPVPIMLWATRREARAALASFRADGGAWALAHYWKRARVVPVRVTIEEVRDA